MFTKNKKSEFAINIYNKTVEYTREPFFFEKFKLKKEFQSRFEIISIFLSLNFWLLKDKRPEIVQELVDIFFQDLDACLRELGAADLSVGKKMKVLVEKFYGRLESYSKAFDSFLLKQAKESFHTPIERNIFKYSEGINKDKFLRDFTNCVISNLEYLKENENKIIKHNYFNLKKK